MADSMSTILRQWADAGIEWVRFELPDLHGMPRSKRIPLAAVEGFAHDGLNMYGGTIALDTNSEVVPHTGYAEEIGYADQLLFPDWSTAAVVPWAPRTARVICDPKFYDGRPLGAAPRLVATRALAALDRLGFEAMLGLELEFYLLDANRQPLFSGFHIFNTLRNERAPVIDDILRLMPQIGIPMLTANCEYAPSQFELNFAPGRGLTAADNAYTFKAGVKELAQKAGQLATFMTKPRNSSASSGCHTHFSLWHKGSNRNAFAEPGVSEGLSELVPYAVGGMLAHAPACMALFAPTINCYRRFRVGTFAPANVSWGHEDRTAAVRVKGVRGQATRIENRLPTAVANPYLIVAGVVSAVVDGLRNRIEPPPPTPSGSTAYANTSAPPLPASLGEALVALEQDEVMCQALGEEFIKVFTVVKRHEIGKWNNYVSDWERNEYLELL
jgi:glutamine synthetase